MNDQKRAGLVIQIQILPQQAPDASRLAVRYALPRFVAVKPERLDIADRFSLRRQYSLKRSTRTHSVVMIDSTNSLPQRDRCLPSHTGAKTIAGDGHRTGESLQAILIFLAVCRQAKTSAAKAILETKALNLG